VQTTCPYCGVGCQLELTILNGRIVRSDGVEGVLPNDGRLCVKGRFGYDYVHHPERLTVPLIRTATSNGNGGSNDNNGGGFREASWDEALDAAAKGFLAIKEKYGPDALAGYSSAKCTNEENYLFQKFVRVAFGTNNLDYCTRLCHASTVTAMLKALGDGAGSNSIQDYETADCVLVTGNNMIETHPVTATWLKAGLAKGGKLVVIDPRWTPLADRADVWLQPRLGTDVALLNGMARIAIAEGWINRKFLENRVSGGFESLEALRLAVEPYTTDEVLRICGVPGQTAGSHQAVRPGRQIDHSHRHGHEPAGGGHQQCLCPDEPDAGHRPDRPGRSGPQPAPGPEQRAGGYRCRSLAPLLSGLHTSHR
jgi:predicted molibdopterin-dependent oxidoreductase YjgC